MEQHPGYEINTIPVNHAEDKTLKYWYKFILTECALYVKAHEPLSDRPYFLPCLILHIDVLSPLSFCQDTGNNCCRVYSGAVPSLARNTQIQFFLYEVPGLTCHHHHPLLRRKPYTAKSCSILQSPISIHILMCYVLKCTAVNTPCMQLQTSYVLLTLILPQRLTFYSVTQRSPRYHDISQITGTSATFQGTDSVFSSI